ncbi:MAG: DHH family phosphoesterase [Nanoarchaeota archaeon]|nr:DHH family phosphoesterase [Nanoarchaeota archaeon]
MQKRIEEIAKKFLERIKDKEVYILSHHDTDGITSAAIMIKTLQKLDKKFSVQIVKVLEEQTIYNLPKEKVIVFLDLASGSLDYIAKSGLKDVFIIDHHEIIQKIPENIEIINPELHDKQEISASGLTYLFCKEIIPDVELAKLATLGMIGDMLGKNIDKVNNQILNEGEVKRKRGLMLYPSTRPLNKVLEFSSNPYIPGVTGNLNGVNELLREAGILPKEGKYKSLIELDEQEMSKLVTSILLRMSKANSKDLIGDIFLIKFFNKLEDARELSAVINACSRLGESEIAIQLCLEIPKAKKKAEALYAKYKRFIISGLEFVSKTEKIQGKGYIIINAKNEIKDTIIGTIASILSHSSLYEEGTIVVAMAYDKDKIKVSSRNVGRNGRNVREILDLVVSKTGGEVGGHEFAAGCLIEKHKEEEFVEHLKNSLEFELVKV